MRVFIQVSECTCNYSVLPKTFVCVSITELKRRNTEQTPFCMCEEFCHYLTTFVLVSLRHFGATAFTRRNDYFLCIDPFPKCGNFFGMLLQLLATVYIWARRLFPLCQIFVIIHGLISAFKFWWILKISKIERELFHSLTIPTFGLDGRDEEMQRSAKQYIM